MRLAEEKRIENFSSNVKFVDYVMWCFGPILLTVILYFLLSLIPVDFPLINVYLLLTEALQVLPTFLGVPGVMPWIGCSTESFRVHADTGSIIPG